MAARGPSRDAAGPRGVHEAAVHTAQGALGCGALRGRSAARRPRADGRITTPTSLSMASRACSSATAWTAASWSCARESSCWESWCTRSRRHTASSHTHTACTSCSGSSSASATRTPPAPPLPEATATSLDPAAGRGCRTEAVQTADVSRRHLCRPELRHLRRGARVALSSHNTLRPMTLTLRFGEILARCGVAAERSDRRLGSRVSAFPLWESHFPLWKSLSHFSLVTFSCIYYVNH